MKNAAATHHENTADQARTEASDEIVINGTEATQLTLLEIPEPTAAQKLAASPAHVRFQLSSTTRERGLQHIAEIRQQLAEAKEARQASTTRRLPPRHPEAA